MLRSATVMRFAVTSATLVVLLTLSLGRVPQAQSQRESADGHVQRIIRSLEPDNTLRVALERGDRGNGTFRTWMEAMRKQGVKQASYRVRFVRSPISKKAVVEDSAYLTHYYRFDSKISDAMSLKKIERSGLAKRLAKEILLRARQNLTQRAHDVPSRWECGTLYLNLLDDGILPILDEPAQIYSTDKDKCSSYQ